MIHLSKRLMAVASMVTPGSRPVDVGCDHGHIPIYLVQKGVAAHVLAMDINEGPLARARANISGCGLAQSIETRLSDGLESYVKGEADSLIIAGMGGTLICRILGYAQQEGFLADFHELVLSPHSDIGQVRRLLHELGFRIDKENMVIDAGKYYTIIHAIHGREQYGSPEDYQYGKYLIDCGHPVLKTYVLELLAAREALYEKLSGLSTPGAMSYMPKLLDEIGNLKRTAARLDPGAAGGDTQKSSDRQEADGSPQKNGL